MSSPLVSVVTPSFQAADTLPRALNSLLSQTYSNWESIIIDDGSDDGTSEILKNYKDPRFRVVHLPSNKGRGFARQTALDLSRGDLLCSLDADDWLYPYTLQSQVECFERHPDLAAASIGMVVCDNQEEVLGIIGRTNQERIVSRLSPRELRFPFGPTMLSADLVRETKYDPTLLRACDLDFYIRLLCGKNRAICFLPQASYVYSGHTSLQFSTLIYCHLWSRRVYLRHLREYPLDCALLWASSHVKTIFYRIGKAFGTQDSLARIRFEPATEAEVSEYRDYRNRLRLPYM